MRQLSYRLRHYLFTFLADFLFQMIQFTITVEALGRASRVDKRSSQRLVNNVCTNYFIGGITLLSFELFLDET